MDFADKADLPGPITHTINSMCLALNTYLTLYVHITTATPAGTLVLIRLHNKIDLITGDKS